MYKYQIWTRYFSPFENNRDEIKPELWVECKTMKQVGRHLDLTVNQVRERMEWSREGKLGAVWHVKNGSMGYQILRFRL